MPRKAVPVLLCALLVLALAPRVALAAHPPSELFATGSWNDARNSHDRVLTASASLTFPLTGIWSLGPVLEYNYVRFEQHPTSPQASLPPVESAGPAWTDTTPPAPTAQQTTGSSDSFWNVGARTALYTSKKHTGLYFALEALMPSGDADVGGYLLTPEAGFQWTLGRGLFRVAYQRPYQQNGGDTIDLEVDRVTFGFGAAF